MNFLMTHWRSILLIYAIIGGLVFLGVLLFFAWAAWSDDEAQYYEENYSPCRNLVFALLLGLFIGVPCGLLWPFLPLLLFGLWTFMTVTEKFSYLMGHLADDEKQ